jgi:hypothetical protein
MSPWSGARRSAPGWRSVESVEPHADEGRFRAETRTIRTDDPPPRPQVGAGCAWPAPLAAPPDRGFWAAYSRARPAYNYARLDAFDRAAAARFPGPGRAFLDLSPLKLRADRRVGSSPGSPYPGDCTHMCQPGPMDDLVPRLFLQLVREWPFRVAGARAQDRANATAAPGS